MQHILADTYKILFKLLRNHIIAMILSVFIVTFLSFIILHGACLLLSQYVPAFIIALFDKLPYNALIFTALFIINFFLMPQEANIMGKGNTGINILRVALFIFLAIACHVYMHYLYIPYSDD